LSGSAPFKAQISFNVKQLAGRKYCGRYQEGEDTLRRAVGSDISIAGRRDWSESEREEEEEEKEQDSNGFIRGLR
jgi:hypothetical protein